MPLLTQEGVKWRGLKAMNSLRPHIQREREKPSKIMRGLGKVSLGDLVHREGKGVRWHAGHANLAKGGPRCWNLVIKRPLLEEEGLEAQTLAFSRQPTKCSTAQTLILSIKIFAPW